MQDTNDHDIVVVHDVVEYDVVAGFDSHESVSYLIIGAIGYDMMDGYSSRLQADMSIS